VFLVLAAKAPATLWKVKRSAAGRIVNIERRSEYVNHYSFHIIDPEWGHVTIKMSGHPPFGAQIILNGHEYVARQAQAAGTDSVVVLVVRLRDDRTQDGIDRDSLYNAIEQCLRAEPRGSTLFVIRGRQIAVLLAGVAPDSRLPTQLASRLVAADKTVKKCLWPAVLNLNLSYGARRR
jgi:hypothetical protein